jgi:hypothetical protein
MDPDDIKKGRVLTWGVILAQCFFALLVMMWLAGMDQVTLDQEELKSLPSAEQDMMRAIFKENVRAISTATVAGPIYFVVIICMCLALLGGNWWVRVGVGAALILCGLATLAAPWVLHPSVLQPNNIPIFLAVLLSLVHSSCGAVLLFANPVRMFLHPHRMMYAMSSFKPNLDNSKL